MGQLRVAHRRDGLSSGSAALRRLVRLLGAATCALAMLGGGAAAAQAACTDTWTGAHGNQWGDSANWSAGRVPGGASTTESVCLPAGAANYPVQLNVWNYQDPASGVVSTEHGATVADLTIAGGAGLIVHGESLVDRGDGGQQTSLTMSATGTIAAGGSLELLASDDGPETPENTHGGEATLNGGGTLTNSGTFTSVSTTTQATAGDGTFHNQLGVNLVNVAQASAEVTSGFLDVNAENTVTNQGTWTVDAGAQMALQYNGFNQHGAATSFANDGSFVNNGATIMQQHDHAQVGDSFANPIIWNQQGGSVAGNAIQFIDGAELNDSAGTGSFLFNQIEGQIAGTIPPGQTVTIEGDPNGNGYTTEVTLDGSTVTNHGTLVLHVPNLNQDTNTDIRLLGSSLTNQAAVTFLDEAPHLISEIDVPVINKAGATMTAQSGTTWLTGGQPVTNDGTVAIAPGANLDAIANPFLTGPETFVNEPDGTIAPQISSAASGTFTIDHDLNMTLGGIVSPQLIGGYVPAAGTEFQTFPINNRDLKLTGQFAATTGGFTADYSHETGDGPNYVGLAFRRPALGTGPAKPARSGLVTHRPTTKGTTVRVRLACSKGSGCPRTTISATVLEKIKVKAGKGKKARTKSKKLIVGKLTTTLKAGTSKTVTLKLNPTGRRLLVKAHRLALTVTISAGGKTRKTYRVSLRAPRRTKGQTTSSR